MCRCPDQALRELFRVLKAGGSLAVFDGDYASTTWPAATTIRSRPAPTPPWPPWFTIAGWPAVCRRWSRPPASRSSASTATRTFRPSRRSYLLTLVDRGADALANGGTIGRELAEALKAEARRRVDAGGFYGSITFASLIARKPA